MTSMDQFALWQRTLADQSDGLNSKREILRQALLKFREHTAQLVGEIGAFLPELTVHDITHLDALWGVADQIAGPDYPLNPAEAFVLGGAFLLHDAAHVLAAYEDGLLGIKRSIEWKDLIAHRFENNEPVAGSPEERSALFQILRHLHAKQARRLARLSWKVPSTGEKIYLLENFQLRDYYGDLIGEIAESHHWSAHRVAETFENRYVNAPGFLSPAGWSVDVLKVAFLLRTADAAHIDSQRAPWFLFALRNPDGISQNHWKFQAKMGQPLRTARGEISLSSGSRFKPCDRQAWWLAYDVACMIDRELRDAQTLMRDAGRSPFAAVSVEHVTSPEAFATNVPTESWEPVNVASKISNIPKVISNLGGAKLYGNRPELALRELIQNAADAVRALRTLGGIGEKEGEIEVALTRDGDSTWLHMTDTGIGMSRYVLTEVLLDFGNSLWSSESLRTELPGLASSGFKAVGRFGIGFFSVFMLGSNVVVTTRRHSRTDGDGSDQWLLEFSEGLHGRPALRRPNSTEALRRPGTRVSIALDHETLERLQTARLDPSLEEPYAEFLVHSEKQLEKAVGKIKTDDFRRMVAKLCPTLDVCVRVRVVPEDPVTIVNPDDWQTLGTANLLDRVGKGTIIDTKVEGTLLDLRENSGVLLGRIAYVDSIFTHAIVTHGGLRSGSLPKLAGVVIGHNNSDLVRRQSQPVASREAWRRWAGSWLDLKLKHSVDELSDLHPLCEDLDLPVYRIGSERLDEAQISKWIEQQSEVHVIEDMPYPEDHDDVSPDNFRENFRLRHDILVLPSSSNLAESLGFSTIDYTERLKAVMEKAWGEFKEFDEFLSVGDVGATDIDRLITVYVRPVTN